MSSDCVFGGGPPCLKILKPFLIGRGEPSQWKGKNLCASHFKCGTPNLFHSVPAASEELVRARLLEWLLIAPWLTADFRRGCKECQKSACRWIAGWKKLVSKVRRRPTIPKHCKETIRGKKFCDSLLGRGVV